MSCLGTPADFNPVQFIVDEMMRIAYEDKSHSLADLIARALRHERLNPARRLQDVSPPGRPDIGDVLIPEDAFLCPDIADCPLPRHGDAFDCGNCVPTVPFGFQGPTEQSTAIGVGIGVGLGVGLGLGSALAAFFAAGVVQFSVTNAEAFISSPAVQQGMTKAFARLAGLEGSLDAVKLNWACAADAISTLTKSRLRRLGEEVTVCFEIEGEDEKESLKLCEVLQDVDPRGAEEVMQEELEAAGATEEDQNFELISWSPEPNPRSFNPLEGKAEKTQSRTLPKTRSSGSDAPTKSDIFQVIRPYAKSWTCGRRRAEEPSDKARPRGSGGFLAKAGSHRWNLAGRLGTVSPVQVQREVADQYIAPEAYDGHYSPASDLFAEETGENLVGSPKMKEIAERLRRATIQCVAVGPPVKLLARVLGWKGAGVPCVALSCCLAGQPQGDPPKRQEYVFIEHLVQPSEKEVVLETIRNGWFVTPAPWN
eukprot:Skav232733  [mRNA]  locus=scaffold1843:141865:152843:- [translate_table: standard]